jgi:hypothetical protein
MVPMGNKSNRPALELIYGHPVQLESKAGNGDRFIRMFRLPGLQYSVNSRIIRKIFVLN